MNESNIDTLMQMAQRLEDAAAALETAAARVLEQQIAQAGERIVATVDSTASVPEGGRKTAAAGVATMLAKQDGDGATLAASAIDGALATLSIEQRIAVKAELLRAGLIG